MTSLSATQHVSTLQELRHLFPTSGCLTRSSFATELLLEWASLERLTRSLRFLIGLIFPEQSAGCYGSTLSRNHVLLLLTVAL